MAGSIVQNVDDGDTTARTPSKSYVVAATTPGNPLVVVIGCVTKTRTITSIVDSAANTGWVLVDGMSGSSQGSATMWWNPNPAASITSFVINMSGTSKTSIQFYELGGAAGTVNVHNATPHTTALTNPSEAVTTTGPCIIIAGVGAAAAPSSVAAPFTLDTGTTGSGLILTGAHDIEASAGTFTCTFTQTSEVCTTVVAAFDIAASSTTFPITITVGTVSATASVARQGSLIIQPVASLTATVQRVGKLKVTSGTVTTPATVQRKGVLRVITNTVSASVSLARKGLLGIVASTVTLPVTVSLSLVRLITITIVTGTVSLSASVQRLGKLRILPSLTLAATLQRKALLGVKLTATATASVARRGVLQITTGTVSVTASVARKGLLGISAALSLPVSLVRKGLLLIKPSVSNSVTVTAFVPVTPVPRLVPYMNLTVISESANTIRVEEA